MSTKKNDTSVSMKRLPFNRGRMSSRHSRRLAIKNGAQDVENAMKELEKETKILTAYENGYNIMLDPSVKLCEPPSAEILQVVPRFVWSQLTRKGSAFGRQQVVDKQKAKVEVAKAALERAKILQNEE